MNGESARRYLRLILPWWWLIVLSAIIPAAISYRLVSEQPDLYQARAIVIVGPGVLRDPNPERGEFDLSNTLAAAYAELLTQRSLLEPVIDELGLETDPENLAKQITTRIRSGAQLLEIQVTDTNPEAAAVIANRLADELIRRSPTSEQNTPEEQAFIESQLEDLETKIEKTRAEIDELSDSLAELSSAVEIQETEDQIEALEVVESRYQDTYARLLSVSQEKSPNEVSLFEPALEPTSPLPRRTELITGIAGMAGLGLALSAVVLMDYLDTSLRWHADGGEMALDLPVLGVVPKVSITGPIRRRNALGPAAEGARAIRSKLFLMRPNDFFNSLVLTSPGESEGKSFVLANLAVALASQDKLVVAVDGDMRRPSLHELFDRPNLRGLADVLAENNADPGDSSSIPLQKTDFDGLYLLSAGRPPTDPAGLLTGSGFHTVLNTLKEEGNVILIDSPPVLGPPDAAIISTQAEGAILVVSAGITKRQLAQQARDLLREQREINLLGLVVNRADIGGSYHYYNSMREDEETRWKQWIEEHVGVEWWQKWRTAYVEDGHLTLGKAATRLGISKRQARRWCRGGRLDATRRWLFWWQVNPEGVDRLIGGTLGANGQEIVGATETEQPEET